MAINLFAALGRDQVDIVLVFLRCNAWLNFAAHSQNGFLRNGRGNKQVFARHSKVALLIIRRNTPLVTESDQYVIPGPLAPDACDLRVYRAWRVAAGERNPKF